MGDTVALPVRAGIDADRIRSRFPTLNQGLPVRLDAWSHQPVLDRAIEAGAAGWDLGRDRAAPAARDGLADLLGVPRTHRLVLTRGGAEAVRLLARAWALPRLRGGDQVLLTEGESHASLLAWQDVAARSSAELRFLPFRARGRVDPDDLAGALTPRTRLVGLCHSNPVLGTLLPVAELAEVAHARGVPVAVDGTAAAASLPVDLALLGCDFYFFDGAPLGAPPGTGALVARGDRVAEMDPSALPGNAEVVDLRWARFTPVGQGLDAAAPSAPLALGLAEAASFRARLGPYVVRRHATALMRRMLAGLSRVPGLRVFGPGSAEERGASVAFAPVEGPAERLANDLARRGIAVSAGHHDTMPVHRRLEVPSTCLAWVGPWTRASEVDALVAALSELAVPAQA